MNKVSRHHLAAANEEANPALMRLALKLATGAGKTTVIALLITWQTINATTFAAQPGAAQGGRGAARPVRRFLGRFLNQPSALVIRTSWHTE